MSACLLPSHLYSSLLFYFNLLSSFSFPVLLPPLLLSLIYLISFLHCVSLYLPPLFCALFVFIALLFLLVSSFLSTSFSHSFRLSFCFYNVISPSHCRLHFTTFSFNFLIRKKPPSLTWNATNSIRYRSAHACCKHPSAAFERYLRQVYGHGHVTFNSLRKFVLVTDATEAQRLYQSINCSTVDDKYVFRNSVCQICTGVHTLQICCCRRPDHELHGVKTVLSFRLLFSIKKTVSK